MLVQCPSKAHDVDDLFNQVRQSGAVEASAEHLPSSSSISFSGTARLLSGEVLANPQPPEIVNHNIKFWRNGFTVDGSVRSLDDPANASFLELEGFWRPADGSTKVQVSLRRRVEDYNVYPIHYIHYLKLVLIMLIIPPEPDKNRAHFQGVGRTLACWHGPASSLLF